MTEENVPPPRAGLRAFARELWRLIPGRVAGALSLSLAVSVADAAGIVALVPLLGAVGLSASGAATGAIGGSVGRGFAAAGVRPTLPAVLVLFVAITFLQAVAQRSQTIAAWRVQLTVTRHFRRRLYAAVAGTRWLHFTRIRSSDLLHALVGEAERCGSAAGNLIAVCTFALTALAYMALALRVSAGATVVAAACGALLMAAMRGYSRSVRAAGEAFSRAHREMVSTAGEHLQSMKVVKSYGAEQRNVGLFGAAADHAAAVHLRAARLFADSRGIFTAGSVLLLALVTWVSVALLGLPAASTLLLAFIFFRTVPRLQALQQMHQQLLHDLPAYDAIVRRIAELEAERERLGAAGSPRGVSEAIRFRGVSFSYPEVKRRAVAGVELAVPARRTTAIVGPSGSGKTTVADLVMGLVRPAAGAVVVDGRVLDEGWMRAWREGIGYVAQETVLFHDTVAENLRWARPGAADAELWDALRAAAADAFVAALPRGIDTVVGDRGVRLSGGERQRLALARALLRRPSLLILDEATSALDTENERRIRGAIGALHGQVTILLITHRLSSVRDADAIHVMEAGRLVESGDWATLMALPGGRFRALWRSQEEEDDPVATIAAGEPD